MKNPVEGQVKKTPERVKSRRLQKGSSKEDSRESQVKNPEGQVMKNPVERRVKKTDPSSHLGRRPMTSPRNYLTSAKI
jgi:hypothetical protein